MYIEALSEYKFKLGKAKHFFFFCFDSASYATQVIKLKAPKLCTGELRMWCIQITAIREKLN